MRTLSELYTIVYKTMKEHGQKTEPIATIVWLCFNNKITGDEHQALIIHYKNNKPTPKKHKEFYNHPIFTKNPHQQNWWNFMSKDTRKEMRLFIRKMIRITR
jgi:hypothetical protein